MKVTRRNLQKWVFPLLLGLGTSLSIYSQDTPATLAGEYQALEEEFSAAMEVFRKEYPSAKNDADRKKVIQEKYPAPQKYAARMMAIAEKNPKDPAAADALIWVYASNPADRQARQALQALRANHFESEKMGKFVETVVRRRAQDSKNLLQEILAKSPHRDVQGLATFGLGQLAHNETNREKLTPEAEKLFQEVIEKYADVRGVRGTLGDQAKALLSSMKIAVGSPAPEIEGEDIDGKRFKLSDYRGKVVMIDFWGDW